MPLLVLTLAFVISGAAGLIYEATWTRYLSLFVGHDAYAQILVLVIFLGGMSVGAWYGGRWGARLRSPLLAFAAVEGAAGVIGLLFHPVFVLLTGWAYDSVFPSLAGGPFIDPAKWLIAASLLLPQSVLLGASFPLMGAGVLRIAPELPGKRLALLYFANSLGAAAGVLIAGFVLVPWGGLPGAIRVAALANLAVAAVVAAVAALALRSASSAPWSPAPASPIDAPTGRDRTQGLLLAVSAGTAIASFLYEIDWIRMLSLVLGSATHSFELMLSAFILGLALGSLWISGRADAFRSPLRALGVIQIAMGLCALGTLFAFGASFRWMSWLLIALTKTDAGYQGFTAARYGISMAIMLPATICAGMTLPLITRLLLVRGAGERVIGSVYAWNTFGSIVGVALGALLLLPFLGVKGMLLTAAGLDVALGILILASARGMELGRTSWRVAGIGVTALALVLLVVGRGVRPDPLILASGIFRTGGVPDPTTTVVAHYRDGRTASVAVLRRASTGNLAISTNGKPDASLDERLWRSECLGNRGRAPLSGDVSTQVLLPLITLAYRSETRTAAVVGFGSGLSTHMLLGRTALRRAVTIEIEPEMVAAAREFYPINRRAYDDPRAITVIDDARSYFAAGSEKFDLIMSEPSNPWVSGVSGLFTVEFYRRIRSALTPGGVFGQWLHTYELNDRLVVTVLAALHEVFPDYVVYQVGAGDYLVVARADGTLDPPDWEVFKDPGLSDLQCRAFTPTASTMRTLRLGGRGLFAPIFLGPHEVNSDFDPVLDLGAERLRYLGSRANGLEALAGDWRGFALALEGLPAIPPEAVPAPPFIAVPGVSARTLASLLAAPDPRRHTGAGGPDLSDVLYAQELWKGWEFRMTGPAPSDWHGFLTAFDVMSVLAHRGTAGYANARLFGSARRFVERHRAPTQVRTALEFRRAVLAWDLERIASAGTTLLPEIQAGSGLVDRDFYIDGMLLAAIRLRRPLLADATLSILGSARPALRGDLRDLIIAGFLDQAFKAAAPIP